MGKQKAAQENTAINKVTLAGTVSLLALLLLFLVITILSTNRLASQIKLLTEHPFTVNGNISDVKTNLALMRIRTERLQSYNQPEDIEKVRVALDELYVNMETLLDEIDTLYLGPDEDTAALRNTYENIRKSHQEFLDFSALPSSTTVVIAEYEKEHLYPLYDQFEMDAGRILSYVRGTQQRIFTSASHMSRTTVIWSFVIMVAVTAGLLFFQTVIKRMNQRLYQKNRQFEVLSDTIDETFLIFDKDKKQCDFVSGSSERVLGLPAGALRENRTLIYQYINSETAEEIHNNIFSEPKTSWDTVIEYKNPKSMQTCWLQLRFYRIRENGAPKYIMTFTDRTEERRSSQALQDALINAQKANNAKKDFLSRMSHEIRTPMNAIIGMTTIAAASIEDRNRVESCLEKISYSSKHLLMLINDVLDMSRIESNRMKLNRETFELFQFLNTFVSVVYPQAIAKGLEFTEKSYGFSGHTTYVGDPLRLNQILLNLASNAIKFTPAGGKVSLEVIHLPSRNNKSWLRFVVSDTGIGMDEEGLSRLYTPFEQADASIAGKYGGTGLGMSITQNLVTLMGGYINVKSEPGEGTTFTVELPFEQSDIDLQPLKEGALETLDVLVADDEQDICEHTVLLLEKMKIHAEWVLSGAEAVKRVVSAHESGCGFDVCFIDWKMPEMDGVETARQIREKVGPDTPIIIISAYDWSDIEEEARAAGVNAFIAKPMFQSSIYNVLVNVTNGVFGMSEAHSGVKGHSLDGKRLLVAEDNALNREIAIVLLEMNGAVVEHAENGQEAVKRFIKMEPGYYDAILMDVQMPVMDGCEAARQIRACGRSDARRIPIIATTANAFAEDVSTVIAAGMNAHISKPLDMEKLCSILLRLCNGSSGPDRDMIGT
ncbi:response regulator [Clostridium sp. MCC353]|uniref:hybrid sensor histidine kinase/response regulator n=1 Tax=Clostridium sp. MCC353 TaxID=2592646 RepID=UPI001C027769|nr:response regulator [Clostridium sp. MCC353]